MADPHTLHRYANDARCIANKYLRFNPDERIGWPDVLHTSGFHAWLHDQFAPAQPRATLRRYRVALIATSKRELEATPDSLLQLSTGRDKRPRAAPHPPDGQQAPSDDAKRLCLNRGEWAALEAAIVKGHYEFRSPWGAHAAELLGLTLRTGILPTEWRHARCEFPDLRRALVITDEQSRDRERQFYIDKLGYETFRVISNTIDLAFSVSAEEWQRRVERVRWHIRGAARRLLPNTWRLATLQAARDQFCADLLTAGWSPDEMALAVGLRRPPTKAISLGLAQINVGAVVPEVGIELLGPDEWLSPRGAAFISSVTGHWVSR